MGSFDVVPFWHVNVPERERTAECPEFLRGLSAKDLRGVSTPDSAYEILSWAEVARIVTANRLERFQRVPSQLRRYKQFSHQTAAGRHGSVAAFVLEERLRWAGPGASRPSGAPPFTCPDDYKVLYNDWPYGLDSRIVHLVVWTKFELVADADTGDLTDKARAEIEDYVSRTFRARMPEGNVMWFKNWAALKSIHAVEHFHVMLFDPNPDFIREVTNGDIPQCNKFID
ncbi:hypothetical protein ISF_00138 [Cordyceps fumosorosea ARSEF 2679]|uniref:N-acetylglucosamine-induced protein 1 n=1 Tax=Cordyceps fumosorosea (strain ARSEF 2679) TaxID=1081104 RepID=A0A168E0P8_CORFA|nr:hypothetical protein ISF_00138 [Cordyceps fumosorosea ARSEF 2679]OAA73237.1 hypothetical protein ISF_00138 [Cordyceps fumosorosea ARSEF 2679]